MTGKIKKRQEAIMRKLFVAAWYDSEKVLDRARQEGWQDGEDGLLDYYDPADDPKGGGR